jgi:hypothetical protein
LILPDLLRARYATGGHQFTKASPVQMNLAQPDIGKTIR